MRKNRGITLVSVVITVIILIIIAGVSINTLLGENGILTIAKQAKENMELAQTKEETELNELYKQMGAELGTTEGISYDAIAKLAEFKRVIADAITSRGVTTSKTDTAEVMAANIEQLELNTTKPTGIKADTYIFNSRESTTTYSPITSMSGLIRETDPDNKISEYLSYSDTDGYTVLKSGWYYIKLDTVVRAVTSVHVDTFIYFCINDRAIAFSAGYSADNIADYNSNSFSIFLSSEDKIYFKGVSNSGSGIDVDCYSFVAAYCHPMF